MPQTPVLDEWFGEKDSPEAKTGRRGKDELLISALQHGSLWRCEERLFPLLDAFAECFPECIPYGSKSSLYSSAREIFEEVGGDAEFVHFAHRHIMRKAPHLEIKDMRSIRFLVGRYRKQNKTDEERRRDYFAYLCPKCGASPCVCEGK